MEVCVKLTRNARARQVRLGFRRNLNRWGKHLFCEECALYSSLIVRLSYVKLFTIISSIIHKAKNLYGNGLM